MSEERNVLLELRKLKKYFPVRRGVSIKALEDVSFSIYEGEKFGVVGESGCGKSTLGRVILQLYPQTSGSCIYYGRALDEMAPKYLAKEIARLPQYQSKASRFYQKSLEVEKQAQAQRARGANEKADALAAKAKELRKDAARQLREGSRTVGSLILCKDLPAVQELYAKAQRESAAASLAVKSVCALEKQIVQSAATGKADESQQERLAALREEVKSHLEWVHEWREEAWRKYHGKDILPITERALDPAYQRKLDGNCETGINLAKLTREEMRDMRREMQMIFQDPAASLDPRQSIGKSIEEVYVINTDYSAAVRKEKVMELLEKVGLKREHYYSYPHALSGGQKQRVGIARAIALDTKFVVLDESVSALDVSVQAQILQLLDELSVEKHLTYFFITHDLGVVKHFCDRIVVMYLGNVCELAESKALFDHQLHPYTESLLAAVPRLRVGQEHSTESVLEGDVPSAMNPPKGCPFHTRCAKCMDICAKEKPSLVEQEPGRFVACHLYGKKEDDE